MNTDKKNITLVNIALPDLVPEQPSAEKPDQTAHSLDMDKTPQDKPYSPKNVEEFGGPQGPEPTRFGDWERNGRCSDF